jgi:dihydroflavonol-4-reductase
MILVTGGTGLLGSHLLTELIHSGKAVRALKRDRSDTSMVRKIFSYYLPDPDESFHKIEWIDADLLDFSAMDDALDGVSEIYHCGAMVSFYPKDHPLMLKVNINGTANLVNLAIEKNIRKFLYVSSVSTLGRNSGTGITDEETFWKTSAKNTPYSISKYGGEREVWRGIEEGLNAVIVNPSVILGPGFWNGTSGLFTLMDKGLKFYPKGMNGYVDVKDVVKSMIHLMDSTVNNERFIINSENVTYRQLFNWIAEYLRKPPPSIYVSPGLSQLAWRVEAIRSFITRSKPELTRDMALTTSQRYTYNNDKFKKIAGFTFIPVEDSIRDICSIFLRDQESGVRSQFGQSGFSI